MYLVRLIYASSVTEAFKPGDIENILESARLRNVQDNVTGMLCFNQNYFLQCLEGSRTSVNGVYHRILNDPRHTKPVLLDYQEILTREFTDWAMGYISESSLTAPLNLKFSGTPFFEPYSMSGESCHQMMLELREGVPVL